MKAWRDEHCRVPTAPGSERRDLVRVLVSTLSAADDAAAAAAETSAVELSAGVREGHGVLGADWAALAGNIVFATRAAAPSAAADAAGELRFTDTTGGAVVLRQLDGGAVWYERRESNPQPLLLPRAQPAAPEI